MAMCERFGIPIAQEKTEGPVNVITYLGLEIDALNFQIRVPEENVSALVLMLQEFMTKSKVTLRKMQSLIGSLNFVCKAVGPGATLFFPLQFRTPSTFYPSYFNYFIIWVSPLTE